MIKKKLTRHLHHVRRARTLARPKLIQGVLIGVAMVMLLATLLVIASGRLGWLISNPNGLPASDVSTISLASASTRPISMHVTMNPPILSPIDARTPVLSIAHEMLASPEHPPLIHAAPASTVQSLELVTYAINISVPLPTRPVDESGKALSYYILNFTITYTVTLYQVMPTEGKLILKELVTKNETFTSDDAPTSKNGSLSWRIPANDKMLALHDQDITYQFSVSLDIAMTIKNETTGEVRVTTVATEFHPDLGLSFVIRHWTILPDVGVTMMGIGLAALPALGAVIAWRKGNKHE